MMKKIVSAVKVLPDISIKEALKKIDEVGHRILFVCDEKDTLIGSLTDGDIRRRILKTGNLQEKIATCYNPNPTFMIKGRCSFDEIKALMLKKMLDVIPIVDMTGSITEIIFWDSLFNKKDLVHDRLANVPVAIMSGGKGKRLDPFTKILPKALMPVHEKPILEIIIDKFYRFGVKNFYVTLNYRGEMVRTYFESIEKKYKMHYIWEKNFSGTAASLKLLPPDIPETFIISNCDVIVDLDYPDLMRFHAENRNILTVVGSIQHYTIPYGIIKFEQKGKIKEIKEKPELDFTVNAGVYILDRKALSAIPANRNFDMTELINLLLEKGDNVGVYPVSQKSYVDIGQWEKYREYIERTM